MTRIAHKNCFIRVVSLLLVCFIMLPMFTSCALGNFDVMEMLGLKPAEEEKPTEAPKTYTVVFKDSDNSVIDTVPNIEENTTVTEPSAPTKGGYEFLGWFKNQNDENPFDFATPITEDTVLYARWREMDVYLTCTATEFYINESTTVFFYAQTKSNIQSVTLYNTETMEVVAVMMDNGEYSANGDDLQGDGVFSCVLNIYETEAASFTYCAIADTEATSNELQITVAVPLTNAELENMQFVNDSITTTINDVITADMTNDQKAEAIQEALVALSKSADVSDESYVKEESICYDSENGVVSFEYGNGVAGLVILDEFTASEDGVAGGTNGLAEGDSLAEIIANTTNLPQDTASEAADIVKTVGDATIMYSFDDPYNSTWLPYYQLCKEAWDAAGLLTDIYLEPTVQDYKTAFLGSELIVIAEHGSVFSHGFMWLDKTYIICTAENVTKEKNTLYSSDIRSGRIYIATLSDKTQVYCLTPKFFEFYYGGNKLDNSIVYMGNCMGFGSGKKIDNNLASAFVKKASAETVYGYHESVYIAYGLLMLDSIVDDLLQAETTGQALKNATEKWGATDNDYAKEHQPTWDTSKKPAATPILYGSSEEILVDFDFKNGSFEENLNYWNTIGDVRVIKKLSELSPTDAERMAILTTGIGSAESEYLQGTEGSMLLQTFIVPENVMTLSLSYDIISEEPMEWVGSEYDDQFIVELLNANNEVICQLTYGSVNTCTWYQIENIDFEGGDGTTYHTNWLEASYDQLADYAGQILTLRIRIWDVGDSIYDTAALIDNVRLH